MSDIVRIVIKSMSRPGPAGEVFRDRLTLCPDSVRYLCRPAAKSDARAVRKWYYKTTAPAFRQLFLKAASAAMEILERDDLPYITGSGVISLAVNYADGTVLFWNYTVFDVSFEDCFSVIRQMLPSCEDEPNMFGLTYSR